MSKEDLELEDDFLSDDIDDTTEEAEVEIVKSNLARRRVIDHMLEERRLQKQIADFDFDF